MNAKQALQDLGITDETLTSEEKRQLDEVGFVLLRNILSPEQVDAFNTRLDDLLNEEGDKAGVEMHQEAGTERLARLIDKDSLFDVCFTNPRVLAAASHVLGEFRLCDVVSRTALPGQGAQGLHADAPAPDEPGKYRVCNTFWLLDDFTAENGATRVVPGSHCRDVDEVRAEMFTGEDGLLHHPDEIQVIAPAGTVVIFNSHLFHGGTLNITENRRRAISSFFLRRDYLELPETRAALAAQPGRYGDAVKYVLGS